MDATNLNFFGLIHFAMLGKDHMQKRFFEWVKLKYLLLWDGVASIVSGSLWGNSINTICILHAYQMKLNRITKVYAGWNGAMKRKSNQANVCMAIGEVREGAKKYKGSINRSVLIFCFSQYA